MDVVIGLLIALFIINGTAIRWYQIKAWRNSDRSISRFLFKIGLFSNTENFNKEGKRYLKISNLLVIPLMALGVTMLVLLAIYDK